MAMDDDICTNQYLTFKLDSEVFGLAINKVREVLDFTSITRVPQAPEYMRGVINLRGCVVPVIDLRLKFGLPHTQKTVNTCIIITEIKTDEGSTILGALADSVQEVLDLDAEQIEPPPRIGSNLRTEFIQGMGKHDERFIILLDIDRVFTSNEIAVVQDVHLQAESELAFAE